MIEIPPGGILIGCRRERLEQVVQQRSEFGLPPSGEVLLLDAPDPEKHISGRHCWVGPDRKGRVVVRDLGSTNGTYVGASDERVKEAQVRTGQVVRLGRSGALRFRIEDDQPECAVTMRGGSESGAAAGKSLLQGRVIHLQKDTLNIGRAPDNDLVLDYPQVSRHHCRIVRREQGTFVYDLGSSNGTFVNGHRVKEARLAVGDAISLGSFVLAFEKEGEFCHASIAGKTRLVCADIRKAVKEKVIIRNISFVAMPGEFTGLIGPSGSGKTTLLNVITGYDCTATGRVEFSGLDLYANYDALRGNIGYVPQDDIIHRELTVEQSLYYTAKLRLPEDTSEEEVRSRVDRVIAELGLEECRRVRIGDPEKRGISGGQRKRVNLAQELITGPACLFLDEPLSGLDPATALEVTEVLAEAAKGGRSVILTTHNVESARTFDVLGNVLLLHAGRLVYFGPAREMFDYFGFGRDFPPHVLLHLQGKYCPKCNREFTKSSRPVRDCPGCHADLLHPPEYWEEKFRRSPYYAKFVAGRMEVTSVKTGVGRRTGRQRANGLRQWWILVQRYLRIKAADRVGTAVLLAQAPLIAVLFGLVFGNKDFQSLGPLLFMMATAAIWFGATNSCREIVSERSVYRRERMVNLKIPAYVLSKTIVLALFLLFQCLVLAGVSKLMVRHLPGGVFEYTGILFAGALAGCAMGLLMSAVLNSPEAAMGLVPVSLIPQVLFAGTIIPLHELGAMRFMADFMVSRWTLDALVHVGTVGRMYWFKESLKLPTCPLGLDFVVLGVLACLFTGLTFLALKQKDIV